MFAGGTDFPPAVPPLFLPSSSSSGPVTACWRKCTICSAVGTQGGEIGPEEQGDPAEGKLDWESGDDQLSHHHTVFLCDSVRASTGETCRNDLFLFDNTVGRRGSELRW